MKAAAIEAPLERDVQKAVLDYLNTLWNVKAWRANTGASTAVHNGKKRFIRYGQRGQADITGVANGGVRIEIEIKRPGNKPTMEQTAWLGEMRTLGAVAFWCDSVKSCSEQLRYEFQQRGWDWPASWNAQ
jgi:hypothetical protein